MQGRFPEAMAAFDRCDEISGNSDVANLGRAQALAAQNRYGEAVSTVLKGRTVKTSNDFYWLSSFYAGNSDKEKALATLQNPSTSAIVISPQSTPTPHSLPSGTTPASSNSSTAPPNSTTRASSSPS
jgi:hypothetical protein